MKKNVDFRFVAIIVTTILMAAIMFLSSTYPEASAKVMNSVSTGALYFALACVAIFVYFVGKLMFHFFKEMVIK